MRRSVPYILGGFVLFIVVIIFSNATFITIKPGYNGILFKKFSGGLNKDKVYGQGFHVLAPWNDMIVYNTQIQENFEEMDVLSANGLQIHVEMSVRYSLTPDKLGYLHETIGPNYLTKIITPELRSTAREVVGQYTPEELYSTKRTKIQNEIGQDIEPVLKENYINLDALLIRSIKLPSTIKEAIERKLQQEQQAQEYEFRLVKETKEAQRKEIEAKGIQQYQEIINRGLTDELLKWKGIEATQDLANSPNTKVIVIGGSDGMPLIMNTDK